MIALAFVWAGLGLIFGSFTNVLIMRYGTGKTVGGRSACLACLSTLTWIDLWPVLSWAALRGRCRSCGSRISAQYPLVELLAMLGFLFIGLAPLPLIVKGVGCAIVIVMLAIAVYDYHHTIIPDPWVFSLGALALVYLFLAVPITDAWSVVLALLAGPIAALPLFILWAISSGAWMGFGDVKLALPVGWVLGPIAGFQAILVAFFIGAAFGIVLFVMPRIRRVFHMLSPVSPAARMKGYTMQSEVPFGPFVIIAFFIIWFAALYDIAVPLPTVFLS